MSLLVHHEWLYIGVGRALRWKDLGRMPCLLNSFIRSKLSGAGLPSGFIHSAYWVQFSVLDAVRFNYIAMSGLALEVAGEGGLVAAGRLAGAQQRLHGLG